jgi:hypothetical protein
MKAILLEKNGGPEILTIHEIPEPVTTEGSGRYSHWFEPIEVLAFGLKFI